MKFIVMRHGEAAGFAKDMHSDSQRNLTPNGINQAIYSAKLMTYPEVGLNIREIYSSTYNRTYQTAEQVAKIAGLEGKVIQTTDLALTTDDNKLIKLINELQQKVTKENWAENDALVLVTHIPIVYILSKMLDKTNNELFHTACFSVIDNDTNFTVGGFEEYSWRWGSKIKEG